MKRIKVPHNGVPVQVPVTKFEPPAPPTPPAIGRPEVEEGAHLPPAPAQINAPVGPPPVAAPLPEDYAGYVALAKRVSTGAMTDKALLWATLALADATNRQANFLAELVNALHPTETELPDGTLDEVPPGLSMAISDGIVMALSDLASADPAAMTLFQQAKGEG